MYIYIKLYIFVVFDVNWAEPVNFHMHGIFFKQIVCYKKEN